ncbi:MAG TPA: O-acetyl-ADP-ribose deacetylase [Chitinophagaceae bacterium]
MQPFSRIEVILDNITRITADAIVNAANSSLLGGGGVDGAIHRAGGPAILEECRRIVARQGGCETGTAVITTAGKLKAKYVIHTVGPVWNGGTHNERKLLADCYTNSLLLASEFKCKSIAFPNISTGVYRFPKPEAAAIAITTISNYLQHHDDISRVILVCFAEEDFNIVNKAFADAARP